MKKAICGAAFGNIGAVHKVVDRRLVVVSQLPRCRDIVSTVAGPVRENCACALGPAKNFHVAECLHARTFAAQLVEPGGRHPAPPYAAARCKFKAREGGYLHFKIKGLITDRAPLESRRI